MRARPTKGILCQTGEGLAQEVVKPAIECDHRARANHPINLTLFLDSVRVRWARLMLSFYIFSLSAFLLLLVKSD